MHLPFQLPTTLVALWATISPWLALDQRQFIFMLATPFFIITTLWEYLYIRHDPLRMDTAEAIRNFMLGAGYQITELLFAGILAFPVYALAYQHRLFNIALNIWSGLLLFVLTDLCFYIMHRLSHRVRWFWCAHVTHHSSERMNFSTAMRQNATNIFNGGWLFYVPLAWLGFNPVWIGVCYALSLVYQFFIHSTLIPRLHPWIEAVMNTPQHHRVHHACNAAYIDKNYAGVFIIWDRWLGTWVEEQPDTPIKYGIYPSYTTRSLWLSWMHEYLSMLRDIMQPGSWRQRLRHLWMPPAWQRSDPTSPASMTEVTSE